MAKLQISDYDGLDPIYKGKMQSKITLSRRNLLALLHKLDMEGSKRRLENNVVYVDGEINNEIVLVMCCEDDAEHYSDPERLSGQFRPGNLHPDTESFIRKEAGK